MSLYQQGYDAAIQNKLRDPHAHKDWLQGYDAAVRDTMRSKRDARFRDRIVRVGFSRSRYETWSKDHVVVEQHETFIVERISW